MASLRELTLDEMLADPIVHLMMARDGVVEDDVRYLIDAARRLRAGRGVETVASAKFGKAA